MKGWWTVTQRLGYLVRIRTIQMEHIRKYPVDTRYLRGLSEAAAKILKDS